LRRAAHCDSLPHCNTPINHLHPDAVLRQAARAVSNLNAVVTL
jgi:hypothetical protein